MRHPTMKCRRWQLQWRSRLICASAAMLFFVLSAHAQTDAILPPMGGSGGGQFIARCPQGQHLTGFELRTGDDVDAIRLICVTAYGPAEVGPNVVGGESFGGNGVGLGTVQLLCPRDAPIVTGMYVQSEGVTKVVNNIHLFCGVAATSQEPSEFPSARFDGPRYNPGFLSNTPYGGEETQRCAAGLVAVGINGRSGKWLDAVGLICGALELTPKPAPPPEPTPVKALGRVKVPPGTAPNPLISICESARRARARNNAAADGLEAKCRAAGEAGEAQPPAAPEPAPGIDVEALAAKGEAIANEDPLAAELRNQQPEGNVRRGFDIGMAAVEGQTLPGPGKQRIHDSLSPAEQEGFTAAVSFSLERNRNAKLAARGAAIAKVDPIVLAARTPGGYRGDVLYALGFDIATGIFGNPALGAQGNTATGPGSLKIRDSLSAAGQRGFNASVRFHLSRNYKP